MTLASYVAFLKAHEKLLIVALAGFLTFHFYSKAIDAWVHHDDLAAKTAANSVKADTVTITDLQSQLATLQKQVTVETAAANKAIAQRNTTTQKQQQVDQTLPLPALGARWTDLLKLTPTDITPTPVAGQLVVSDAAARATVNQLELVPTLEANNLSLTNELRNDSLIVEQQTELITSLNKDITDEKASHVADVKDLKAKNRRSFLRGFKIGFVAGFIGGLFAGHSI